MRQPQSVREPALRSGPAPYRHAALWAGNVRDAEILRRTTTDPHSLGRWRVNATLRNIEDFYQAFGVTEDNAMYLAPEERVIIW